MSRLTSCNIDLAAWLTSWARQWARIDCRCHLLATCVFPESVAISTCCSRVHSIVHSTCESKVIVLLLLIIISAVHATAGRWSPQRGPCTSILSHSHPLIASTLCLVVAGDWGVLCSVLCHCLCGIESRSPPRWFRAAWRARQLSLTVDCLAIRLVVWGYSILIADPKALLKTWPGKGQSTQDYTLTQSIPKIRIIYR